MENSLNLAQIGYGLTDVVKVVGIFMAIIGLTLTISAVSGLRLSKETIRLSQAQAYC